MDPHALSTTSHPLPRHAQSSACAQARGRLAAQRPTPLHVQRLVNCLVADAHRGVFREVSLQSMGDLLCTPCARPSTRLPPPMAVENLAIDPRFLVAGAVGEYGADGLKGRLTFSHPVAQSSVCKNARFFIVGRALATVSSTSSDFLHRR